MKSEKISASMDGIQLRVGEVNIWVGNNWYSENMQATNVPNGEIVDSLKIQLTDAEAENLILEMARGPSTIMLKGVTIPVDTDWCKNAATSGRTLAPNDGFFPGEQVGLSGNTILSVPKSKITGSVSW